MITVAMMIVIRWASLHFFSITGIVAHYCIGFCPGLADPPSQDCAVMLKQTTKEQRANNKQDTYVKQ